MAFLAYYLHWGHDEVMNLDHRERRRWCAELSKINKRLNGTAYKINGRRRCRGTRRNELWHLAQRPRF